MNWRVKYSRLRKEIDALGDFGLARTSQGAKVSVSTLQKMYAGTYDHSVRDVVRERMFKFFKVKETDIFELVTASEKKLSA